MQLTKAQSAAVQFCGGHLQLIACAGSGKTEVVARHVARLLLPVDDGGEGLSPRNIVAFTFTEKAAAELKHRITERALADNPASQKELIGVGLAVFGHIAVRGQLTELEQMRILGIQSRSTLRRWRGGRVQCLRRDTLERLSYVIAIYRAVNLLQQDGEHADAWMRAPGVAPALGGSCPVARMARGKVGDLYLVRQLLEAEICR